ncbi:hypothetical protein [Vibrio crassostreae]|uniref:hypothetical protein n=1 Tax=Vibrio crassostreae TaxID=246167 RepID=UPI001B3103BF|nr:hypothetical protein [Vibrio crassostreae]
MKSKQLIVALAVGAITASSAVAAEVKEEKNELDPTKIVTKAGVSYTDALSVAGSVGLDEARMLNARVDVESGEWRLGGSWLFDFGIVNFNFSRTDYEHDAYRNNYSVGTFIPLEKFGVAPLGIKIFPMAGFNYNDGEYAVQQDSAATLNENYVLTPSTSTGGYLGAFALKPIDDKFTLMAFGGGAKGSDDYDAYWFGGGAGYKINDQNSLKFFAFKSDGSFGVEEKIGFGYTHEFD